MTRAARIAACALAAAVVTSLGTSAQAAPRAHQAPRQDHHHHVQHDGSTHVLVALGRLDRQLARSIRHRLSPLTDADRATLRANAASDQATVEAVATAYSSTPSGHHLLAARGLLRSYHPERYVRATAMLRRDGHAEVALGRLGRRVVPGSSQESDLSAAAELLAGVSARGFTARTTSADMRDSRAAIKEARALVARVRSELDAR